ncbi:formylglycine-generating enzyme family protein [Paucibacter sp. TC2R-5]|uniref:formylglycine-generating enzyme family protein n=1 Tax=Paucibacter sp. TC2R-5 TaxID=2893555 RepID=UPI0021E4C7D4|nr:formylglycine-generating enzyme family protein [Paucibacter sp. TC2R-5]MCV2361689.1 formylglycine-generating enzyme family protein [Paucibacter sp. TC2R-5]
MKYWKLAALTLISVFFVGCSSVQTPESAESLALRLDLDTCRASSLLEVPPKMVVITPAISLPDQMRCSSSSQSGGATGCERIPGLRFPAVEDDLNAEARAQLFSACLMVKRYSVQPVIASAPSTHTLQTTKSLPASPASLTAKTTEGLAAPEIVASTTVSPDMLESLRARPWQGIKDCDTCPRMVLIPSGSFNMGSTASPSEQPVHTVKLRSFLLGKYEVTQAEWQAVMGKNPSANTSCGRRCPVERVTWNQAQEFLKRLNSRTGLNFRLPSEAEWEYAARAGQDTPAQDEAFQTLKNFAWYNGNSGGEAHPVGQKIPNPFGLHDMQGNVWEWVEDAQYDNYQGAHPAGLARQVSSPKQEKRILRGGSYFDNPKSLRTSHRNADEPDAVYVFFGLRVARDLEPATRQVERSDPSSAKPQ